MPKLANYLLAAGAAFTWWVVAIHLKNEDVASIRILASIGWLSIFSRLMGNATQTFSPTPPAKE
jgi:hypothetical protein